MPRFKVQAQDGKILTIEAADEAGVDMAMKDYHSSVQIAQPEQKQEPSFMQSTVENAPFGQTVLDVAKGENPYQANPKGVGRLAGDIGTGAGLVGAGMAAGSAWPVVAGAGAGALAGAALEKSGVSPYLREKANEVRQSNEIPLIPSLGKYSPSIPQHDYGSEELGGLGQAANLMQEISREQGATQIDLVPTALSGVLGGLFTKGLNAAGINMEGATGQAPGAAGELQARGGDVTPAMVRAAEGKSGGIATGAENVARANPLTSGMMQGMDKKNAAAIQSKLSESIPASNLTPQGSGGLLGDTMENFQARRGSEVAAAKGAAKNLEVSDVGKIASNKIIKRLEERGVPSNEKGFAPETMKGTEGIGKATAETLVQVERDLRGATLPEAINYLDNFDETHGAALSQKYPAQASRVIQEARSVIKDTIVEAIGSKDPALAKQLRKADRQYSVSQPTVTKVLKNVRGETPTSEIVKNFMGKAGSKADKGLSRLSKTMNKQEFGNVQDSLVSEVLRSSTGKAGLSLAKLETSLNELGENSRYLKPEHLKALNEIKQMMKTANVMDLEFPNPPGTAAKVTNALLTSGGAIAAGQMFHNPLIPLGAAGLTGANALYMKLPALKMAAAKLGRKVGSPLIRASSNPIASGSAAAISSKREYAR